MKTYIGTKIIQAEPCSWGDWLTGDDMRSREHGLILDPDTQGYKVKYRDGYVSWSPKAEFDLAYREITQAEKDLI